MNLILPQNTVEPNIFGNVYNTDCANRAEEKRKNDNLKAQNQREDDMDNAQSLRDKKVIDANISQI